MGRWQRTTFALVFAACLLAGFGSVAVSAAGAGATPGVEAIDRPATIDGWPGSVTAASQPLAAATTVRPLGSHGTGPGRTGLAATTAAQQDWFGQPSDEFDRTQFHIAVAADGNATWTFRYERPIESDAEREEFQTYAQRFRTEETDLYRDFRNQTASLTTSAASATGRPMTAANLSRDARTEDRITREVGVVELSFVWTAFGATDEETVRVGDVFEGGLYLGPGQSLVLEAGDRVRFESVTPDGSTTADTLAASERVSWVGEREFPDQHPRATFAMDTDGAAGQDAAGQDAVDESEDAGGPLGPWLLGVVLLAVVLALVLVALQAGDARERLGEVGVPSPPSTSTTGTSTSGGDSGSSGSAVVEQTEEVPADPEPEPEPLTDEQRVVQLLEGEGGRLKQSEIVDRTEWSKSKVSMLLSDMEDEGTITKIQIGRENIIALDGSEPEAATSPFDDPE